MAMNIKLSDLLDDNELKAVEQFISKGEEKELRNYLNVPERAKRLKHKGVIADYLYYVLMYNLKK